jgi:hypothetical protein
MTLPQDSIHATKVAIRHFRYTPQWGTMRPRIVSCNCRWHMWGTFAHVCRIATSAGTGRDLLHEFRSVPRSLQGMKGWYELGQHCRIARGF